MKQAKKSSLTASDIACVMLAAGYLIPIYFLSSAAYKMLLCEDANAPHGVLSKSMLLCILLAFIAVGIYIVRFVATMIVPKTQ